MAMTERKTKKSKEKQQTSLFKTCFEGAILLKQ